MWFNLLGQTFDWNFFLSSSGPTSKVLRYSSKIPKVVLLEYLSCISTSILTMCHYQPVSLTVALGRGRVRAAHPLDTVEEELWRAPSIWRHPGQFLPLNLKNKPCNFYKCWILQLDLSRCDAESISWVSLFPTRVVSELRLEASSRPP